MTSGTGSVEAFCPRRIEVPTVLHRGFAPVPTRQLHIIMLSHSDIVIIYLIIYFDVELFFKAFI